MKYLTEELLQSIPKASPFEEEESEPMAYAKFFLPYSGWIWFAMEFDGDDKFFGFVFGVEAEYGLFYLSQLEALEAECDLNFTPTPISKLRIQYEQPYYKAA